MDEMDNEELNEEASMYINEMVGETMKYVFSTVAKSNLGYSDFNLAMNILTGVLSKVMFAVPDEERDNYIEMIEGNLRVNLANLRKKGI